MNQSKATPVALTIAGSDASGGAGIQADLKTFTGIGAYGMSAITAITVQNTQGVQRSYAVPADLVTDQIDAVMDDIGCDAAKTGMLANAKITNAVADAVEKHDIERLVVDPVITAQSGDSLLADDAIDALISRILPLAYIVAPNLDEVDELTGQPVERRDDMACAALELSKMGPDVVIVKGGHLRQRADDLMYIAADDEYIPLPGEKIDTANTHGSGCTFSAAITAGLAMGKDPIDAAEDAKRFVTLAIENALPLGSGNGPTNHMKAGQVFGGER